MNKKIDDGKILSQKIHKIKKNTNSLKLLKEISLGFRYQIKILFYNLKNKKFFKNNEGKSNYWRKRNFDDGIIDFRMSAESIYRLVLALAKPYPNAVIELKNKNFYIKKAKIIKENNKNYFTGQIIKKSRDYVIIKCYKDAIKLYNKSLINSLKKVSYL
tara:strand:- start:135 stop:611 length:477 start_codon:yes stop_codon:yes gene_type:complete